MGQDDLGSTRLGLPERVKTLQFEENDAIDAEERYQFVRKLGRGAMGKVFLFKDVRLNKYRALKTVDEILTQYPDAVESLKNECNIMQDLTHPNIVAVRDLVMDQWGYRYYIVMDYAEGVTLYQYLSDHGKRGAAMTGKVVEALALALDYAHGMGLVHRDVKPDNIMVQIDGENVKSVKLLDFGIGRAVQELLMATTGGMAGGGAGAPAYRSPEEWNPRQYGKLSARSDQYSLAVIAYEMLAGRRPYWEFDTMDTLRCAVLDPDEIPERIDGVEDDVNDALLKALSKRPENRFESCMVFAKALFATPSGPSSPKPDRTQPSTPTVGHDDMVVMLPGDVPLELVHIHAGSFLMGSPATENGRYDNETQHHVTLTRDYWLGRYEVTQGQWKAVMGSNPSYFRKGDRYPVENVGRNDAMDFCRKVTEMERSAGRLPAGYEYTLPTEAQWEYACRAGTSAPFSFGFVLNGDKANCNGGSPYGDIGKGRYLQGTAEVGSYAPNAWGLYDMHGNLLEWCRDWYGAYPSGPVMDPTGPSSGVRRVLRGGSWRSDARGCRSAFRGSLDSAFRHAYGFRVALAPV